MWDRQVDNYCFDVGQTGRSLLFRGGTAMQITIDQMWDRQVDNYCLDVGQTGR